MFVIPPKWIWCKNSSSKCKRALIPKGRFLSVKYPTTEETEKLSILKDLIEAGKIKPFIDRTYSLEQIVEAHQYVDKCHKRGNVVIKV